MKYENENKWKWSVQKLIYTGMLAALAGVLMSLEFSVPLMPPLQSGFQRCAVHRGRIPDGAGVGHLCGSN